MGGSGEDDGDDGVEVGDGGEGEADAVGEAGDVGAGVVGEAGVGLDVREGEGEDERDGRFVPPAASAPARPRSGAVLTTVRPDASRSSPAREITTQTRVDTPATTASHTANATRTR